ncbi:hypothetical protein OK348_06605 [Flavobacterium sp. MXW15]|uniref:DUF1453 domain-containing protein n=1 Tax=Xanthomonas chitinilytica TaxID=2989819 RepID=A0ABT3JTC7_9XANT|nr:DUF1453 domain-containing protein [Xanthomonas sp. H13-6]MCW4454463.1 hypothetical protein [Flavobacterium sp. MXW15]MCW4471703.1 DUF1453 domain-containing protein [Xanthomonas sp. H13-6]
MPLLLALPLAILVFVALMVLLLPLSLWQRLRSGSARRQARPWAVRLNLWATLLSCALFAAFVGVASLWWPGVWWQAALGGLAGALLGAAGSALTRFEPTPGPLFYTPNPWLALALTLLVLVRLGAGLVQGWRASVGGGAWPAEGWMSHGSLLAAAALLLGYAVAYAWLLQRRLRRHRRYRGYDRTPR